MFEPGFVTASQRGRETVKSPGTMRLSITSASYCPERMTHIETKCMASVTLKGLMLVTARLSCFRGTKALMDNLLV